MLKNSLFVRPFCDGATIWEDGLVGRFIRGRLYQLGPPHLTARCGRLRPVLWSHATFNGC